MRRVFRHIFLRRQLRMGRGRGFSLVELLMAIAILGLLAGIAYPAYVGYTDRADRAQAMADIREMENLIERFYVATQRLPNSLADIGMAGKQDPWGNPYQFLNHANVKGNGKGQFRSYKGTVPINTDYDLYSMGKDGQSQRPLTAKASRDDIVRGLNGEFIGMGSELAGRS